MKRIAKKLLYCFFTAAFSFFTVIAFAQVKFTAMANSNTIARDEVVQVEYLIENVSHVSQFVPPSFKNFQILSGPNYSSGWSFVNGNLNQYVSIGYVLKPLTTGKLNLPAATAKISGKSISSNTVSVEVLNAYSGSNSARNFVQGNAPPAPGSLNAVEDFILRKGEDPIEKIKKNLFLKVDVDKKTCYEGEPVVASYKLYTRIKSESKVVKRPSFNGFSVYDMVDPESQTPSRERLNGKEYNVYLIRKAQLYPLESGKLELEPVEVENKVTFIKSDYANLNPIQFDQLLRSYDEGNDSNNETETHNLTLNSDPVTIEVKALPDTGRPLSFNGAVGNFAVSAVVDKTNLAANEMATVKLVVTGRGNLPVVNAPDLVLPDGFEKYEPKVVENINKFESPISGSKVFEYRFSPRKQGAYIIPSVEFSYFNPRTKNFEKAKTDSMVLQVSAPVASASPKIDPATEAASVQEESEDGTSDWLTSKWVWSLPVLAVAGLGVIQNRRLKKKTRMVAESLKKRELQQQIAALAAAKAAQPFHPGPFMEARRLLMDGQNGNQFYEELSRSLWQYFGDRFNIRPSDLNQPTVTRHLYERGFDETVVDQFHLIINQCEWALYTPQHNESDMQSAFDLAEDLIRSVEQKNS